MYESLTRSPCWCCLFILVENEGSNSAKEANVDETSVVTGWVSRFYGQNGGRVELDSELQISAGLGSHLRHSFRFR